MATLPARQAAAARILKAYDFADAAVKHLITLATAIIGGAIAIFRDPKHTGIDLGPHAGAVETGLWLMVVSAGLGLFAVHTLAGTLERPKPGGPSIYNPSIRLFWAGQIFAFVGGLAALAVAATQGVPITDATDKPVVVDAHVLAVDEDIDCGSPADGSLRTFRMLEPGGPDPSRWLESGTMASQLAAFDASLRTRASTDHGRRTLAAILLIGSTDERPIAAAAAGHPHGSNAALAMARARAIRTAMLEHWGPLAPPVLIVNSAAMPVSRIVMANGHSVSGRPREMPSGREVFSCALWKR